jgi:MFS family permease
MSVLERTISCPPDLAGPESHIVSEEETKAGSEKAALLDVKEDNSAVKPSPKAGTPSICTDMHSVDMSEVARKLSSKTLYDTTPIASPLHSKKTGEEDNDEDDDEVDDEEGGAHDTITSLAGVKMLQKFSKIGNRDRKYRLAGTREKDLKGSINQLESLFKEDPLLEEDEKNIVTDDEAEADSDNEEDVFVPPDGGYGWFVSLGAFIALFWTAGLVKSYGVLFAEMMRMYPESISLASWIPAAMTTTALAMAPIASALCQKLNCRYVTLLGSLLASAGITLSAFMPNLQTMFVTLGVLTGAGIGLATTPGIILTARYFDKRRSMANALCLSGTAAGSFTLPILMGHLLNHYGFHGTLLIIGGCMLHVCISAALFRPLATHVIIIRNKEKKKVNVVPSESARTNSITIHDDAVCGKLLKGEVVVCNNNRQIISPTCQPGDSMVDTCSITPVACSLPTNALGTPHSTHRFNLEEFSLSRQRSIHSSFDSISMMSSVSNRSFEHLGPNQEPHHVDPEHVAQTGQGATWSGRTSPTISNTQFSMGSSHCPVAHVTNAKSLSLKELAFHQIGSHINLYRTMFVGSGNKMDVCEHEKVKPQKSNQKTSLMFSCEDIMVDSTSVLKDSRHPSHQHLGHGGQTHRVVSINRTQSAVGDIRRRKTSARARFYSESFDKTGKRLSRNSSFCRRSIGGDRMSLIGSTELFSSPPQEIKPTRKFILQPVPDTQKREETEWKENKSLRILKTINKYIDLSLVKDPVFLLLAGSVMLMAIGVPHCLFFLPTHAKLVGLAATDASYLLSISAIFDLAGRLVFGFFLDLNLFPKYLGYSLMMLIAGISAVCLPSTNSFLEIAVCMGFYGVGTGGWFLMVPLLLAEHLGVENIASSYGLARLFQSVTNLSGPMLAGLLLDQTGDLTATFYMMGVSMSLGALVVLFLPLAIKKVEKKNAVQ